MLLPKKTKGIDGVLWAMNNYATSLENEVRSLKSDLMDRDKEIIRLIRKKQWWKLW